MPENFDAIVRTDRDGRTYTRRQMGTSNNRNDAHYSDFRDYKVGDIVTSIIYFSRGFGSALDHLCDYEVIEVNERNRNTVTVIGEDLNERSLGNHFTERNGRRIRKWHSNMKVIQLVGNAYCEECRTCISTCKQEEPCDFFEVV